MNKEHEIFTLFREELYTPVVGDILDSLGYFHQFLPPEIKPVQPGMKLIGRAMPVLMKDVYGPQKKPFGKMMEALDDLQSGEIYIAGGGQPRSANWGEIMTAAAKTRGACGAVVAGYHRDTPRVLEQDFPVFSLGTWAQDSAPRMKVEDFRVPIEIGGISICNGDLIFGDIDGVLVIPEKVQAEVISRSLEKARGEKTVRKAIEGGMSVVDAFNQYGIL